MLAVVDTEDLRAQQQLALVPGWFADWEQQLSRFRKDSDLSQLNAAQGRKVAVRSALWEVIKVALQVAQQSNGLVCPTLLGALESAGYDRTFDELAPQRSASGAIVHSDAWRAIVLDPQKRAVTLPAGVRLDLGGIAKGWAAEQAAQLLSLTGPALVDAGGDIAMSGPMDDNGPWPIAITNPFEPEDSLGTLLIKQGAVATSGRDYRRWQLGDHEMHHIIDPRTDAPAKTDLLTVTIVAPTMAQAEMSAKAVLIQGSQAGLAWLESQATLAGLLVLADGQIIYSRSMPAFLEPTTIREHAITGTRS